MMSASSQCGHSDLHFHLNNVRFGNTNIHYLEVTARCNVCAVDMVFRGLPAGLSPDQATSSLDGKTASIPFLGEGEVYDGKASGYFVKVID